MKKLWICVICFSFLIGCSFEIGGTTEKEQSTPEIEKDWSEINLYDWERQEIRLSEEAFLNYLAWVPSNFEISEIKMVDATTIEAKIQEPQDEAAEMLEATELEAENYDEMVAMLIEPHLRQAYKASTFYQDQQEPTFRFLNQKDEVVIAFEKDQEERQKVEEAIEEENRTDLGNYGLGDTVEFKNEIITFTGASTIARRLEDEIYSPIHVVRVGVSYENLATYRSFAAASRFEIKDHRGKELDLYDLDNQMSQLVNNESEIHEPIYFVASGYAPYKLTFRTDTEKATWLIYNDEVGIAGN
ncbi:hypothetical protein [Saliterribacillus persicus]|uniref:Uncharacterized protein n=1 Tax=Saliterribacillus persicus TaxID=930114 RepID=A0A368YAL9_9BACI|nr:hypothetical protein [Saliterribacillus persicus]RCW77293.1 hypothetical protein DFR57_101162 [Saliterribacillus persicus]